MKVTNINWKHDKQSSHQEQRIDETLSTKGTLRLVHIITHKLHPITNRQRDESPEHSQSGSTDNFTALHIPVYCLLYQKLSGIPFQQLPWILSFNIPIQQIPASHPARPNRPYNCSLVNTMLFGFRLSQRGTC